MDGGPIEKVALFDQSGVSLFGPSQGYNLEFNGSSTIVVIPDNAAYSQPTTGELTIAAWFRPDTLMFADTEGSGYVHWLSKVDTDANEWVFRMYSLDNTEDRANRISFYLYSQDGLPQGDGVAFQETVVPKQWMHVCATVNSSKLMTIYKNGESKNSFTTELTLTDTATPVRIGSGAQNANPNNRSYFKGSIRDVQIYNRVLSSTEISQVMDGKQFSGLVGRWKLTEGSGITAYDDSSNMNNAPITDGLWV